MKKIIISLAITLIVIIGVLVLITSETVSLGDLLQSSFVIIIVLGFGMFILFKNINSNRGGEPSEDELSKLIIQKTSSVSFYISLYLWLVISYLSSRINIDVEELIGYGIVGMAIVFAVVWSFFKVKGFSND